MAGSPYAPPDDTGEAQGLPPSRLTVTVGFGPGLFEDESGRARFGLDGERPPALAELPHFIGDDLQPGRSGGDIAIQACADDPQVAVHAIRNLTRIGFGRAELRWSQLGFGRTSSTTAAQATPRNMFGFKDGTKNIKAEEAADARARLGLGRGRRRPRLADRRLLPGGAHDPDADRDLGPRAAGGPGGDRRAAPRAPARRCREATSSPSPT